MVAKQVCAQNVGQSSSSQDNAVQERSLFSLQDEGKAMAMEDTCKQNIPKNEVIWPNGVQGEIHVLLRSDNDGQCIQKLPGVTNESSTVDLDGVGRQPYTMEPFNSASVIEPYIAPTIGAFTVQCAKCMKWRFIPTKEQYEVIRQSIVEKPFFCSSAATWRSNASCNDPLEISPDLHELWAVDRPSIPLPPDGWERLLVIRPPGSSKFADVYYITPSGRKLRSMPETIRYLEKHPEYSRAGVKSSQFSFLIPKPLDKDYSKKKDESLPCDQRETLSNKQSDSKGFSTESYLKKVVVPSSSFKGNPLKPKLEKLKCRKKAITLGGDSQGFHVED